MKPCVGDLHSGPVGYIDKFSEGEGAKELPAEPLSPSDVARARAKIWGGRKGSITSRKEGGEGLNRQRNTPNLKNVPFLLLLLLG